MTASFEEVAQQVVVLRPLALAAGFEECVIPAHWNRDRRVGIVFKKKGAVLIVANAAKYRKGKLLKDYDRPGIRVDMMISVKMRIPARIKEICNYSKDVDYAFTGRMSQVLFRSKDLLINAKNALARVEKIYKKNAAFVAAG